MHLETMGKTGFQWVEQDKVNCGYLKPVKGSIDPLEQTDGQW